VGRWEEEEGATPLLKYMNFFSKQNAINSTQQKATMHIAHYIYVLAHNK